jgi:hypothetical protein
LTEPFDWVKLHNAFYEDEDIESLSDAAFRAWVTGVCLSDRLNTDGRLTGKKVASIAKPKVRQSLVDAGVWLERGDDIEIVNFLKWQRSAVQKDEAKRKKREAGRLGGLASGEARREANAEADASPPAEANAEAKPKQRESKKEKESSKPLVVFNGSSNGLPNEKAHEIVELLEAIGDHADAGTEGVLSTFAKDLPFGAIAKVRDSLERQKPDNRAQYAVAALRDEVKERKAAK